jgi:hypothetical protein
MPRAFCPCLHSSHPTQAAIILGLPTHLFVIRGRALDGMWECIAFCPIRSSLACEGHGDGRLSICCGVVPVQSAGDAVIDE